MKNIKIITVLFLLMFTSFYGQECNCTEEFLHVKNHMENNYAGFKDKVNSKTRADYDKMTNDIIAKTKNATKDGNCIFLVKEWMNFFNDGHVGIRIKESLDMKNRKPEDFQKYIDKTEIITLSEQDINRLKKSRGIEGVYWSMDSTYQIAIVKNKTLFRDYAGIIVSSKTPFWKPNQVKLEFKKEKEKLAKGMLYYRNHLPGYQEFRIDENSIGEWRREGVKRSDNSSKFIAVESKKLSDKTLYIKIGTFQPSNAKAIDSVFKAHKIDLEKMPNLVLDLRNNGGGSDFSYSPISPYLYTNPIKGIGVDVLASQGNIDGWKKILQNPDIPDSNRKSITGMIEVMELNKGKLVNISEDNIDSTGVRLDFPKKIAILINKGCASSTEQFLLEAKQSKKVTLVGENTEGVLDYSNVRETDFACMPFVLRYATTRSRRLDVNQGIDNVGIEPNVKLDDKDDWVVATLKLIEQ